MLTALNDLVKNRQRLLDGSNVLNKLRLLL